MSLIWIYISIPYLFANIVLSVIIHRKYKKYVNPKLIKDTNNELYNLHDKFPEFKRYDNISFLRIFIGMLFMVWIRLLGFFLIAIIYGINLK